jgi:hypothetical protein
MSRVYGALVRGEKCIQNLSENLMGRDYLGKLGIGGRIILKWVREIGHEGMYCIHLARDRIQWHSLVNTVMKLQVP